jgi:hypothetical protein
MIEKNEFHQPNSRVIHIIGLNLVFTGEGGRHYCINVSIVHMHFSIPCQIMMVY